MALAFIYSWKYPERDAGAKADGFEPSRDLFHDRLNLYMTKEALERLAKKVVLPSY